MFSKMKRSLLLLLVLALLAAPISASAESLIDAEKLQEQQASYSTAKVQLGSFIQEYSVPVLVYYPLQQNLKVEQNGAIFKEFAVEEEQNVKKGDVLAYLTVETSDAALEQLEREIARLEAETELGISQRNDAIELLEKSDAEGFQKEKNAIALKKAKAELAHYEYLQQRSLDTLKQALKAEQEKRDGYTLVAPADGKVIDLAKLKTGDPVAAGDALMTFVRTDVVQLRVSNSSGDLRYNMPVTITVGKQNNTATVSGRVVAADGAIPEKERTGYAYIQVDTQVELADPKLTAEIMRLDNVLVAERGAVVSENGRHYVTKLVDGMLQRRYIGFGANNADQVWIIHGVAEGDILVTD